MRLSDSKPTGVLLLARLGWDELRRLAAAGELTKEVLGIAADGAQEYVTAMASGDVARPEVAQMRVGSMSGCGNCPSARLTATDMEVEGGHVFKLWCGKSQRPDMKSPRPTCGCLVGLKVNGKVYPGPKVWVGSAACPQGMW